MKSVSTNKQVVLVCVVAIAVSFAVGYFTGNRSSNTKQPAMAAPATLDTATMWTCSMHPQIQAPEPGRCPLCGMDLIPRQGSPNEDQSEPTLELSATARKLAQVVVQPVERRRVTRNVRMVGSVVYDETRLATITARVGGRLDRLYVDYTGVTVKQGDHMVWMYSPEILAAQEELLQAKTAADSMANSHLDGVKERGQLTLRAARDKLHLWGLSEQQITAIEQRGTPSDHIQINAPIGGVVIQVLAQQGTYVQTGTPIYRIADLSHVWVKLDAYESDLPWLRYGQKITFTSASLPGETFTGRIAFIAPVLTTTTRTVKVRVNVPNPAGTLKPGMFIRAVVHAQIADDGRALDASLAGKWVSPMHPEVVSDGPGTCTVCGMPLVKAEELGFNEADSDSQDLPLVIPATAPLLTGKRAIVYVQVAGDPGRFEGRTVTLGARAGDDYIVQSGLADGELVVVNGNFKIDSALQLRAHRSMMSSARNQIAISPPTGRAYAPLFHTYLQLQQALARDDRDAAVSAATEMRDHLAHTDTRDLASHEALMAAISAIAHTTTIDAIRQQFKRLSTHLITIAQQSGTGLETNLRVVHCPMAFGDSGADWLQRGDEVTNPYFGPSMLRCGNITSTIPASHASRHEQTPTHDHDAEGHHHE